MNPNLDDDDRDRMEGNISDPAFALNQVILGRHLFERVDYGKLSSVQKQIYNRQKACAILADTVFHKALDFSHFDATEAWIKTGKYHFPSPISAWLLDLLAPYRLQSS